MMTISILIYFPYSYLTNYFSLCIVSGMWQPWGGCVPLAASCYYARPLVAGIHDATATDAAAAASGTTNSIQVFGGNQANTEKTLIRHVGARRSVDVAWTAPDNSHTGPWPRLRLVPQPHSTTSNIKASTTTTTRHYNNNNNNNRNNDTSNNKQLKYPEKLKNSVELNGNKTSRKCLR